MGNCCAACREPDGTIYDFTKIKNATSCPPPGYSKDCYPNSTEYWWC